MNAKYSLFALCAAACLAAVPAVISAEPAAKGDAVQKAEKPAQPEQRRGMLTKEQKEKQRAIMREHNARMEDLKDALMQKQMELDYLADNPNVKPEDIKAIIADIVRLHKESRKAGHELRAKMREAGLPFMLPRPWHGPRHGEGFMPGHRRHFDQHGPGFAPEGGPQWEGPDFGGAPRGFHGEQGMVPGGVPSGPGDPAFAPVPCQRFGAPCGDPGRGCPWLQGQGGAGPDPQAMGY